MSTDIIVGIMKVDKTQPKEDGLIDLRKETKNSYLYLISFINNKTISVRKGKETKNVDLAFAYPYDSMDCLLDLIGDEFGIDNKDDGIRCNHDELDCVAFGLTGYVMHKLIENCNTLDGDKHEYVQGFIDELNEVRQDCIEYNQKHKDENIAELPFFRLWW